MGHCPALAAPGGAIHTVPEKQRDSHHHQDTPSEHLKGGKDGSPAFTMEGKLLARTRKQELFHQGGSDLPIDSGWYHDRGCAFTTVTDSSQNPPCAAWGQTGSWLPLTSMGEISTSRSSCATSASSDYRGQKQAQSTGSPLWSSRQQSSRGLSSELRACGLPAANECKYRLGTRGKWSS